MKKKSTKWNKNRNPKRKLPPDFSLEQLTELVRAPGRRSDALKEEMNIPLLKKSIVEFVAAGGTVHKYIAMNLACPGIAAVLLWLKDDEVFKKAYEEARESRADSRADRIDDIVEAALAGRVDVNAARLAIDTFKWQASVENRGRYGDKIGVDHKGKMTFVLTPEDVKL